MSAIVMEIVEKVIPLEPYPSVPSNFVLREGESIPAQIIVENPNVSLYCLDDQHRRALFVETQPGTDLVHAPFYYVTQYQKAQRVIAVPYDELHAIADDVALGKVGFIYSIGRCGSTLISSALNEVDGVISLSEPDLYTQITMLRYTDNSRDEEYTRLLKSGTRLLCRNSAMIVIKFRACVIHIGDLLFQTFPDAKNLFLYRNAESWAQSMNSAFASAAASSILQEPTFLLFLMSQAPLLVPFVQRHERQPELTEAFALLWLSILEKYVKLNAQGFPFLAVRYEDIVAQPKAVLAAIFAHMELPAASVDAAYGTFSKDSQEGTVLSREHRKQNATSALSPEQFAQLHGVLQEYPALQSPDTIVPDTLTFGT